MNIEKLVVHTVVTEYGHDVIAAHPHAKWENGELVVGGMTVRRDDNETESFFQGKLPIRLVARSNGDHRGFLCGVDLIAYEGTGTIWIGLNDQDYANPEEAWKVIRDKEGEFYLCIEEPFQF